jgi:hypothetical protein
MRLKIAVSVVRFRPWAPFSGNFPPDQRPRNGAGFPAAAAAARAIVSV